MMRAFEHLKKVLKQKRMRFTKQRKAIVDLFLAREGHICADELYYALRKKHARIGRATVFRTVKLLKDAGMASEVDFTGKRKRFEHAFEHAHHDHLICEECGKIIEFVDTEIERRQERLSRRYGFKARKHYLQIFGFCKKCVRR
jgi:Fur family ferric uptake transcriptional regulator